MIVYNSETIREKNAEKTKNLKYLTIYRGSPEENLKSVNRQNLALPIVMKNSFDKYDYDELEHMRYRVANASNPPSQAELEALLGRVYIEVARRVMGMTDLTTLICNETVDPNLPETTYLRDLIPPIGKMKVVSGQNDPVPLIEQKTGVLETITLLIRALGYKDTIKNLLFNRLFSMDQVIQAAVTAYIDERNNTCAGQIIGTTFDASNQQAADGTSGLTLAEKTYKTIQLAITKLRNLKNTWTGQKIAVPSMRLLINSVNSWNVQNVINGQLQNNGGGARGNIAAPLGISSVVEFDQGENNGQTWFKEILSFPGVPENKGYLFVPGVGYSALKNPLQMQIGRGSVLELSTEERAWWAIWGNNLMPLLGSSYPGFSKGAGYGALIEISFPTS